MTQSARVGEWKAPNHKRASGLTSHHAPETRRGFVESSARKKLRVFCEICRELRAIAGCTDIDETEKSSTYTVVLSDCGHSRSVTIAVEFTPSARAKRGWQETVTPIDPEVLEIRADLESEQLL